MGIDSEAGRSDCVMVSEFKGSRVFLFVTLNKKQLY